MSRIQSMLLAACLCVASSLSAQAQSLNVLLSGADTVAQGQRLQLTYAFENVAVRKFLAPELVGLKVLGGPSRQSQTSIVNGRRTSSLVISYYVVADQPGLALVPSVVALHEGDTLRSEPIQRFIIVDPDYVPFDRQRQREPDDAMFPTDRT